MADTTIDTLKLQIQVSDRATTNLKKIAVAANETKSALNGLETAGGGKGRSGGNKSGGVGQALSLGTSVFKIAATIRYAKKLGVAIGKMVQSGMDFTETLNLWQKAMRGNVGEARNFITEMNRAYGISEKTLMQYQATFKNMLSAMSRISEDTAYKLSEAMSRMALDYASLYNVSIEETMSKFQAVLSGQIRPIRTISGYDVSEQSIFGVYQQIGGTKTMRQLDQTEKRMLRILAIFYQMDETKAIGDMAQTLYTNANQFRIMKEQAQEFTMWVGNGVSYLLEESRILVHINAALIVMKELAKGIAYSLGYREETVAQTLFEDMQDANEEAEKFSGLLGFDKFQALKSGSGQNATDIESVLLSAMEKYESMLGKVNNPAMEKAEKVLRGLGLEMTYYATVGGKTFKYTEAEFQKWYDTLTEVEKKQVSVQKVFSSEKILLLTKALTALALSLTLVATNMSKVAITSFITKMAAATGATWKMVAAQQALSTVGLMIVITQLTELITRWDEMAKKEKVVRVGLLALGVAISLLSKKLLTLKSVNTLTLSLTMMGTALALCTYWTVDLIKSWENLSSLERAAKIMKIVGAAAVGLAGAMLLVSGISTGGIALAVGGVALAAVGAFMSGGKDILGFKDGGVPQKGSLFYAGEAGAELVTNTGGGKSAVMNMQQLQVAITRGMIAAMSTQSGGTSGSVNLSVDGQSLFSITKGYAKKNGYDFVKVK